MNKKAFIAAVIISVLSISLVTETHFVRLAKADAHYIKPE